MIQILRRDTDNVILLLGIGIVPHAGASLVDITDAQEHEIRTTILAGGGLTSVGLVSMQPLPPTPPAPDITGLINALTSSPSIDQPTKNALIAALKGV